MSSIKSRFAQIVKIFGIMAIVAVFAAAAFPSPGFADSLPVSSNGSYGKALVTVIDASNPSLTAKPPVIAGAVVEVANASGVGIMKTTTDSTGTVRLALPGGVYKIRVTFNGYNPGGADFTIVDGTTQNVTVGLTKLSALRR
jgi:hypothetical protein